MVFYHGFYLFGRIGGVAFCETLYRFFSPAQLLFASAFICISGVCTNFSRSPLRRGLLLSGLAVCISLVTVCLLPRIGYAQFQDRFGILHLLGCCMCIAAAVRKLPRRLPPVAGVCVCVALYAASAYGLSGRVPLPDVLLQSRFLFPLGLHGADFYSADYFPLLPHLFIFFIGVCIGRALCTRELSPSAYRTRVRAFAFLGRHSLVVYLAHVPCILLILYFMERF